MTDRPEPDPTFDMAIDRKTKKMRVYIRRDLRDKVKVVTPATINAWVLG